MLEAGLAENKRLRIKVAVEDVYYPNSRRPFMRRVEWWLKEGDHGWGPQHDNVVYGNFSSNQGRAAAAKKLGH